MLKKMSCFFLGILLLLNLSGCSIGKTPTAAIPAYYESDLGSKLGLTYIAQIKMNPKNQLVVFGSIENTLVYRVLDEKGKTLNELKCEFKGDGSVFALDAKDQLYILVQDMKADEQSHKVTENKRKLLIYNFNGEKLKDIDLGTAKMQKDENIAVQDMVIDANGNLNLIKANEPLEIIDQSGNAVASPYKEKIRCADIDEDGNLIAGTAGNTGTKSSIVKLNPGKENPVWKKDLEIGEYIKTVDCSSAGKNIYALMDNSITRYDGQGNSGVKILEFLKYGLMSDKIYINRMAVDGTGNIYINLWDNTDGSGKSILKAFTTTKPEEQTNASATTAPAKGITATLNLSAHFSDRWLENAVGKFQSSHPGIAINVKDYKGAYYGDGDTPAEASKRADEFVKTINTELMAGKGPDIIYFSDLPYRKYVDKNAFCNLSELMEKDQSFNRSELNMKVLDALKYKGALYTMPVNYQFGMLIASKAILDKESIKIDDANWTWKDFMDIAEKVTKDLDNDGVADQLAFPDRGGSGVFSYMLDENFKKFVDLENKKVDVLNPEFKNLLDISKAFAAKKLTFTGDWPAIIEKSSRGGIVFNFTGIPSYSMAKYFKDSVFAGDITLLRYPSDKKPGDRVIKFSTGNMFAINSQSKYKAEAWEFMKLLLSKEMQSSIELQNGFPVNNEALKESAKTNIDMLKTPKEFIDTIDRIIPEVGEYDYSDQQVGKIISEETSQVFTDKKSADDAVKAIQNKLSTYIGE